MDREIIIKIVILVLVLFVWIIDIIQITINVWIIHIICFIVVILICYIISIEWKQKKGGHHRPPDVQG